MNFDVLKSGFREYLEKNNALSAKEMLADDAKISIFMHSQEFREYLSTELKADKNLVSNNLSEILKLEIVDGKLVDPNSPEVKGDKEILTAIEDEKQQQELEAEAEHDVADPESPEGEEVSDTEETPDETQDSDFDDTDILAGVLNDLLEDETFLKAVDRNGDGEFDKDEFENFIKKINRYDDDLSNFTLDDLLEAVELIKEGKFDITTTGEDENGNFEDTETQNTDRYITQGSSPGSTSGRNYSSGGYAGSTGVSPSSPQGTGAKSLDELKAMLPEKQTAVETAQTELESITSGEKYQTEQAQVDDLENAYKEALEKEANIQGDPPVAQNEDAAALITCNDSISKSEKRITELNTTIVQKAGEISSKQIEISGIQADIKALEAVQASNDKVNSDDPAAQSEIQAKNAQLAQQMQSLNQQLQTKQAELTKLQDDQKKASDDLTTEQNTLDGLKTQKTDLETKLKENCSAETKQAMDAFNEAKAALEAKQNTDAKTAASNLAAAQKDLADLQSQIQQKEAEQKAKDYAVDPMYQYNEEVGKKLALNASTVRGTTGMCLAGVNDTLAETFGLTLGFPSAYMAADALRGKTPGYEEIASHFREVQVPREQLANLPAGAIVVWDNNQNGGGSNVSEAGRIHGHISVSLGDGRESSDYIAQQTVNRDAEFSVFIPVA